MAAVSISLYQKRETTPSGGYRVISEVTSAADIEEQLFLFKYVDGTGPQWNGGNDIYQHVTTTADNKTYPIFTDIAPSDPPDFYRYEKVVLDYGSLAAAQDQAAIIKTRMGDLATDWQTVVDAFEGTENYTYRSSDGQVEFELEQVQAQAAPDDYLVTSNIVVSPTGIARELFLYEADGPSPPDPTTDTYVRVVTVDDINRWPASGAWTTEQYYRSYTAPVSNVLLGLAETHSATTRTDLEALAQDYDTAVDDFEGEETTIYTG